MQIIKTNLKFKTLTKRQRTDRVIEHHAAGYGSAKQVHASHLRNGWSGIGYHYLVRQDGTIEEGRPEWAIGAHAGSANYNSIGICCEGNFEIEQMPAAQKKSVKELTADIKKRYAITKVQRHSEVSATACPGRNYPFSEIAGANVSDIKTEETKLQANPVPNVPGKSYIVQVGQIHANNFCGANIKTDGVRGANTVKAGIKVLQTAINFNYKQKLKVDGVWGSNSKAALGNHYVKLGEKQYMVTAVQILLMLKGYACELQNPGKFDKNLEKVVKQYQKDYQLTVDGVVGYYTLMSLIH